VTPPPSTSGSRGTRTPRLADEPGPTAGAAAAPARSSSIQGNAETGNQLPPEAGVVCQGAAQRTWAEPERRPRRSRRGSSSGAAAASGCTRYLLLTMTWPNEPLQQAGLRPSAERRRSPNEGLWQRRQPKERGRLLAVVQAKCLGATRAILAVEPMLTSMATGRPTSLVASISWPRSHHVRAHEVESAWGVCPRRRTSRCSSRRPVNSRSTVNEPGRAARLILRRPPRAPAVLLSPCPFGLRC